jgi:hypothetical protein
MFFRLCYLQYPMGSDVLLLPIEVTLTFKQRGSYLNFSAWFMKFINIIWTKKKKEKKIMK